MKAFLKTFAHRTLQGFYHVGVAVVAFAAAVLCMLVALFLGYALLEDPARAVLPESVKGWAFGIYTYAHVVPAVVLGLMLDERIHEGLCRVRAAWKAHGQLKLPLGKRA